MRRVFMNKQTFFKILPFYNIQRTFEIKMIIWHKYKSQKLIFLAWDYAVEDRLGM
jgi:hypothetical protein